MSRIRSAINTTVDPKLHDAIKEWMAAQPVAPTMSAVVERALIEFLENHGRRGRKAAR
jgi:hypothetical protein